MVDWESIVGQSGPAVWRTAYRLLGNRADAEDCFQEAFLDALQLSRRQAVRHWPALLRRLATARAVDRLRRRYRRAAHELTEGALPTGQDGAAEVLSETLPADAVAPPQQAEAAELSALLREALAELPGRQAEVFCLHCLEGWSYQEIATHLETTTDAVGVTLHRARGRLRELLAPADVAVAERRS